ncbi:hypothetical protein [Streptomyces sp. NPDC052701]|uniref:hypothetical protein n=1 Tax=Streptomyces sp. NPDC052701 TaxID=3155533 RepID=UPI003431723E
MKTTDMRARAAALLTTARTAADEERERLLEEVRLWIELARLAPASPPETVPEGTVMQIRTRGGALTAVMERTQASGLVYPWTCLGCGDGRKYGTANRSDARQEATRHALDCWVLPEPTR